MKKIIAVLIIFLIFQTTAFGYVTSTKPEIIDLHYQILRGVGFNASEPSDLLISKTVTTSAMKGEKAVSINETSNLYQGQLIVIYSNGEYYTNVISSISGTVIGLAYPLEINIPANGKLHNFYINSSHPNMYGFRAIADAAIRNLTNQTSGYQLSDFDKGVHLLLGDSWFAMNFDDPFLMNRLKERLPNATFINYGVGGNEIDYLYRRFIGGAALSDINNDTINYGDRIDATTIPVINFVWVLSGTNDYIHGTPSSDFKSKMNELVKKIQDRGAKPLVFTSSIGEIGIGNQFELSRQYASLSFTDTTTIQSEQGSWVPTLAGLSSPGVNSYSSQSGSYYKTGKMVVAQFDVSLSAKDSAMSGALLIKGLPYPPAKGYFGVNFAQVENISLGTSYSEYGGFATNDFIVLTKTGGIAGSWNNIYASDISSNSKFRGSIVYFTN